MRSVKCEATRIVSTGLVVAVCCLVADSETDEHARICCCVSLISHYWVRRDKARSLG